MQCCYHLRHSGPRSDQHTYVDQSRRYWLIRAAGQTPVKRWSNGDHTPVKRRSDAGQSDPVFDIWPVRRPGVRNWSNTGQTFWSNPRAEPVKHWSNPRPDPVKHWSTPDADGGRRQVKLRRSRSRPPPADCHPDRLRGRLTPSALGQTPSESVTLRRSGSALPGPWITPSE